jgi:hypothetical protein
MTNLPVVAVQRRFRAELGLELANIVVDNWGRLFNKAGCVRKRKGPGKLPVRRS